MQKTNKISPKSCKNVKICVFPVKPKCPQTIPVNKTKVTPSDTPKILIFPSNTPTAITKEYSSTMCAIEFSSVNRFCNQSIIFNVF